MKINLEQWNPILLKTTGNVFTEELFKEFVDGLTWGTLGKERENVQHNYLLLKDLTTEHLEMILITERQIQYHYTMAIIYLLKNRYSSKK